MPAGLEFGPTPGGGAGAILILRVCTRSPAAGLTRWCVLNPVPSSQFSAEQGAALRGGLYVAEGGPWPSA